MNAFPQLERGLSAEIERVVDEASTARQLGSGSVDVLATPELVRLMEAAAVAAVAGHLPPAYTTVGVSIRVQHLAPTPVGMKFVVSARLGSVQGRRLSFVLVARDEVEEIGRGEHERVLVKVDDFGARAGRKSPQALG